MPGRMLDHPTDPRGTVWPLESAVAARSRTVPAGWSGEGLPVGLQIVARRYRDDEALRIGAALERVRPWAEQRPPI